MSEVVQLDRIDWHMDAEGLPADLVEKAFDDEDEESEEIYDELAHFACAHTGLFIRYAFTRGWANLERHADEQDEIAAVVSGTMTGVEFLLTFIDGKLFTEDFIPEQREAIESYYERQYHNDFASVAGIPYATREDKVDSAALFALMDKHFGF